MKSEVFGIQFHRMSVWDVGRDKYQKNRGDVRKGGLWSHPYHQGSTDIRK